MISGPSDGFEITSHELFRTSQILKNHAPMQAGAYFSCFCSIGFEKGMFAQLGGSWAPFGAQLRASWVTSWSNLGALGPQFGISEAFLEATWESRGRTLGHFGRSSGDLECTRCYIGRFDSQFGSNLAFNGNNQAALGANADVVGDIWRLTCPRSSPRATKVAD